MGLLAVTVAAIAAYAFGAGWYMSFAKPWVMASGVELDAEGDPVNRSNPIPYAIAFVSMLFVAGMMRHMFALAGIDSAGKGLISGFGLGLFIACPWIVTNYAYADRPRILAIIDGGYATFGCAIIGLVLALF